MGNKVSMLLLILIVLVGGFIILFASLSYDYSEVYDLNCYDKLGNEIQGVRCKGVVGYTDDEMGILGIGVFLIFALFVGIFATGG